MSGDKYQLAYCAARAEVAAEYLVANRLDRAVAAAYAELPKYTKRQQELAAALDALYAEQMAKRRDLIEQAREAESRRRREQAAGQAQVLSGYWNFSAYDVYYTDGSVEREYLPDPDVAAIASGYQTIGRAQSAYQNEMSRLTDAKQGFEADAQKKYTDILGRLTTARRDRAVLLRAVGVERFQLDKDAPLDRLAEAQKEAARAKSPAPVVALFEGQAK